MEAGFDLSELGDLSRRLIKTAEKHYPKRVKKFMQDEGTWGKKVLREKTKEYTEKRTGELRKSVRKTPVKVKNGDYEVRVYNKAAYAGHVEHGHVLSSHGKRTESFVPGKHPAAYAAMKMKREFPAHVDELVDEILDEGLFL